MDNNIDKYNNVVREDEQLIDFITLWHIIIGKWYWFVISILFFLSLACINIYRSPKAFRQNATVMVKDKAAMGGAFSGTASAFSDIAGLNMMSSANTDNEIMILQSRSLMESVVMKMNSYITYYNNNRFRWLEMYETVPFRIVESMPGYSFPKMFDISILSDSKFKYIDADTTFTGVFNKYIDFPFGNAKIEAYPELISLHINNNIRVNINDVERTIASYQGAMSVSLISKMGTMLSLSFISSRPGKAKDILNCIIDQYCRRSIEEKNKVLDITSEFISDRIDFIKAELTGMDEVIERYKSSNKSVGTITESSVYLRSATELEERISANGLQTELVNMLSDFLNNPTNKRELLPYNIGLENISLNRQIQDYNDNLIKLNRMIAASSERNPLVVDLLNMLESTRSTIVTAVNDQKKSLKLQKKELDSRNIRTSGRIEAMSVNERNVQSFARDQKIKEALYIYLQNKAEETALSKTMSEANAMVIDRAGGSNYPISPRKSMILMISIIIGVIIPGAWFVFKDMLNTKVRGKSDLLKILTAPILGEIPSKNKNVNEFLIVKEGASDHISEAFRIVRTNLSFMTNQPKVIAITSSQPNEGKTYVAVNLAVTLALTGKKVCLVDLDLRRRSLSTCFEKNKNDGVVEILANKRDNINDLIIDLKENNNLSLLPAGSVPPNPAELLLGYNFEKLITHLRDMFDYIVIDNPPVNIVADTKIANRCVDFTTYVVRAGVLDRKDICMIEDIYQSKTLNNMGVLLTDVNYESLYYSMGYGNVYGHRDYIRYGKDYYKEK